MLFYCIIWNARRWNMQCAIHTAEHRKRGEHPKCLCAHVNVMFLGNLFWASEDKPKVQIQHISSWLHVWLGNLNTGSLRAARGEYVSFSYTWSHTGWPVWRLACNQPQKPTEKERQSEMGLASLRSLFISHIFHAPLFWFFTLSPSSCGFGFVYCNATSSSALHF